MTYMRTMNRILFLPAILALAAACSEKDGTEELPAEPGTIEVRGTLIDIRSLDEGSEFYPQNTLYTVTGEAVSCFDTPVDYAVGLKEYRGPEEVRSGSDGTIYIASDVADLSSYGWTGTGGQFTMRDVVYYIHSKSCKASEWIQVPYPESSEFSPVVFGDNLKVSGTYVPGNVIAGVPELRSGTISNVCIAILPDGSYISSCTGASSAERVSLFKSDDRGASWYRLEGTNVNANGVSNYYNLFVHNGSLYMMGAGVSNANVVISRSDDGGMTWTVPTDGSTGILAQGNFHSAAVPVAVSGGRIWRAMEEVLEDEKHPFVMSAPADADLLSAANWIRTNNVSTPDGLSYLDAPLSELIEGNVVATPEGDIYNILRASSSSTSIAAMKLQVSDENTLSTPDDDSVVKLPGGGKKFTIRYDPESRRYWTLANPASADGMKHDGFYSSGLTYDLVRNRLVLIYSTDLSTWVQYKQILYDADPFFHGFQYVDWQFDGSDIVAVCRMACPESRGLPVRQHDANFMTFHRIENFRSL